MEKFTVKCRECWILRQIWKKLFFWLTLNLRFPVGGSANGIPRYEKYSLPENDCSMMPEIFPLSISIIGASFWAAQHWIRKDKKINVNFMISGHTVVFLSLLRLEMMKNKFLKPKIQGQTVHQLKVVIKHLWQWQKSLQKIKRGCFHVNLYAQHDFFQRHNDHHLPWVCCTIKIYSCEGKNCIRSRIFLKLEFSFQFPIFFIKWAGKNGNFRKWKKSASTMIRTQTFWCNLLMYYRVFQ